MPVPSWSFFNIGTGNIFLEALEDVFLIGEKEGPANNDCWTVPILFFLTQIARIRVDPYIGTTANLPYDLQRSS